MKHVSGKKLVQIADENGWVFVSQSGSHVKMRNPIDGKTIIIPLHGNHDLRAGVQKQIMRTMGLTDADL